MTEPPSTGLQSAPGPGWGSSSRNRPLAKWVDNTGPHVTNGLIKEMDDRGPPPCAASAQAGAKCIQTSCRPASRQLGRGLSRGGAGWVPWVGVAQRRRDTVRVLRAAGWQGTAGGLGTEEPCKPPMSQRLWLKSSLARTLSSRLLLFSSSPSAALTASLCWLPGRLSLKSSPRPIWETLWTLGHPVWTPAPWGLHAWRIDAGGKETGHPFQSHGLPCTPSSWKLPSPDSQLLWLGHSQGPAPSLGQKNNFPGGRGPGVGVSGMPRLCLSL